jgi:hypothetical protein
MTHPSIEKALEDLGTHLMVPDPPNVATQVRARIGERSRKTRLSLRWRTALVVATALVLGFTCALSLSPTARNAVASLLGVVGIHIDVRDDVSQPQRTAPQNLAELDLGEEVSLRQVQDQVDFRLLEPQASPDRVYVNPGIAGGQVTFIYLARPGLPQRLIKGVGMLITEFAGSVDEVTIEKIVSSGGKVEPVRVEGAPGYWIRGAHLLEYVDKGGDYRPQTLRVSSSALIWQRGRVSLRIESGLTKSQALRIARTMS